MGLYLDPPDRAVVLCVDEKSQIQALDRTQPGLPLKKGRAATMTHDYKRHGTTTLFAALDVKSGMVIGDCMPRHRAKEFLTFLRRIDRAVLKPRDIHLVLDNYATHKTPEVKAWLDKHPRFKLHFTPTSASWLNMVERFFAEITTRRIRRGSYRVMSPSRSFMFVIVGLTTVIYNCVVSSGLFLPKSLTRIGNIWLTRLQMVGAGRIASLPIPTKLHAAPTIVWTPLEANCLTAQIA